MQRMPTCEICDSDSFYDQDGKFYCDNCGIQSQEMEVQVSQDIDMQTYSQETKKLKLSVKGCKIGRKRLPHNVGKPWVVFEGIQLMIKAQVSSLIRMGFSPKLKDVVAQLWFGYLKSQSIAFCEEESDTICLQSKAMGRGKNVGIVPKGILRRRGMIHDDDVDDDFDEEDMHAEDFFEEDMPDILKKEFDEIKEEDMPGILMKETNQIKEEVVQGIPQKEIDEIKQVDVADIVMKETDKIKEKDKLDIFKKEADEIKKKYDVKIKHFAIRIEDIKCKKRIIEDDNDDNESIKSIALISNLKKKKGKLNQRHTLALCYIGLILLGEPVLLSDLIRWANDGDIPYHKAKEVFPEEMKMYSPTDIRNFNCQECPGMFQMDMLARKLTSELNIEVEYSKDVIRILLASVIIDLELPEVVYDLVCKLMEEIDFSFNLSHSTKISSDLRCLDGYLCAFIVVGTKLIYGLDGEHETIGESNKYLVEQFGAQSIPTWKDWVEKHLYKSKLKLNNGIPRTINDMQYINDMTTYMNYLSKDVFNSFRQKRASRTHHTAEMQYEKGCNDQAKEEYHKLFTAVAEELNPGRNIKDIKRVSTSFPYSVNHLGHIISSVRKPRIHEGKARDLKTNKEIYFSENINAQEKIQDFDTSFTEKVDAPFGYLLYTRCMNFQDFHDSYKYLLLVIARRLEFTSVELQRYVHYIESLIFEEQLYERYQDWLQCFQILNLRR